MMGIPRGHCVLPCLVVIALWMCVDASYRSFVQLTTAYTVGAAVGPALGGWLGASGDYYLGARLAVCMLPAEFCNQDLLSDDQYLFELVSSKLLASCPAK